MFSGFVACNNGKSQPPEGQSPQPSLKRGSKTTLSREDVRRQKNDIAGGRVSVSATLAAGPSPLVAGEPYSEEQGDGDHPHGHLAQADNFLEGLRHEFFVLRTQIQIGDMDSQ